MSLGGNSINLHALITAGYMCCHLFTNAGDTWYQYLTCSTFPFAGLHKFSKNLGPISKLLVPHYKVMSSGQTGAQKLCTLALVYTIVHCALAPNGVNSKFQQQHLIRP